MKTPSDRYRQWLYLDRATGFALDVSRMDFPDDLVTREAARIDAAHRAMRELEAGGIANPDEQRRVGHYWLRDSARAPDAETRVAIDDARAAIVRFAADVHAGRVRPERAEQFRQLVVVGIGGSALGPQLVAEALGRGPARDAMRIFFADNTDPDGFDRLLTRLGGADGLATTLVAVTSKSGGTKETRNGMLEIGRAYGLAGLKFARHAVAVTSDGSELDRVAKRDAWLTTFPMWDWVGGRTSVMSSVGLVPAALQGVDVDAILAGARTMDAWTRESDARRNPALLLALAWHKATGGRGEKDMVVLPYSDRFELFSRYLQQLVMESLGKRLDLGGNVVHQGIAVYGNKGSTDQHAYVQQLRDGVPNFFATFVQVLNERDGEPFEVEPEVTSGDYLFGFLEGTRRALYEAGRPSVSITIPRADAVSLGMLIALFERAVGFYASFININAYHQPGVEAGKKAATEVLDMQRNVVRSVRALGTPSSATQVAAHVGSPDVELVWKILNRLASNPQRPVRRVDDTAADPFDTTFASRDD